MSLKESEVRYATKRQKDYKLWRLKYRFGGKEKLLSLGGYPDVSLADARLRRAEAKWRWGRGGIGVQGRACSWGHV